MKRTTAGMCVAAAFAFAASLGAQTTTTTTPQRTATTTDNEVSVTGCLERGASGGFVLNNAKLDTDASRSTAATGTTGTTGSTAAGSTYSNTTTAGSTWALEGDSSELEKHVGHKIQVLGKEAGHAGMSGSAAGATTTTGTATTTGTSGTTATGTAVTGEQRHSDMASSKKLDVKSVKMIASSCS